MTVYCWEDHHLYNIVSETNLFPGIDLPIKTFDRIVKLTVIECLPWTSSNKYLQLTCIPMVEVGPIHVRIHILNIPEFV